jgi:hypothetical protein
MSDEDVPEDFYQYQPEEYQIDEAVYPYADIMEQRMAN